jgi:hypothetical protein
MKIPMVDLPLGATEDRVCGTIDIEKALTEGVKAFEPGLLAKANRGILYVDEVNLLDDHLVRGLGGAVRGEGGAAGVGARAHLLDRHTRGLFRGAARQRPVGP